MLSFIDMRRDGVTHSLAPLEFIVAVATTLMLLFLALVAVTTLFGSGVFLGLGKPSTCVEVPANAVSITGNGEAVLGLHHNVSSSSTGFNVCVRDSSMTQKLLGVGTMLPSLLFALGFLGLTWRLLRGVRRHGLFVRDIAVGTSRLGWYVLIGAVVVAVVQAAASARLLETMLATHAGLKLLWFFHVSWAVLFAGFGAVTVGRALGQAVPMQQELDATV